MRRSPKWILVIGFGLLLSSGFFFHRQELEIRELAAWIKRYAVSVNSNEPFLDRVSFRSIASDFEGARVVAIGESTHGTHEFDGLKLEFLKYMVAERNCRIFAVEAGFTRCWLINSQLANPAVSIDSLVRLVGFENLRTLEFRSILQWLRDYNNRFPEDKVTLAGIDIQANQVAIPLLESFFDRMDVDGAKKLIQCVRKINHAKVLAKEPELPELARKLSQVIEELRVSTNAVHVEWPFEIEMSLRMLHQYAVSYGVQDVRLASHRRDSCMALNVKSWADYLPEYVGMLLSAHNGHIREHAQGFFPMGRWLSEDLGSDYFTIGLDFHQGSFRVDDPSLRNSPGWEVMDAEPSVLSIGSIFSKAGKLNSYLLLDAMNESQPVIKWVYEKPLVMNSAGSISVNSFFNDDSVREVIGKAFDSVLVLERSTPTEPLK